MAQTLSFRSWAFRVSRISLVVVCAFVLGCRILLISGPREVGIGDRVAYVLEISSSSIWTPFWVVADVPAGWRLESSTYVATIGGETITGNGPVVQASVCSGLLGEIRPGFRRWHVQSPNLPDLSSSDVGEVTLEFLAESQPAGEFRLFFALGGNDCSPPHVVTINQQPGSRFLELVQALFDDTGVVDGFSGPVELVPSPDGAHLYVAGGVDQAIAAFSRDELSGQLTFVEAESGGLDSSDGIGPPVGAAASPDGLHLYVPRSSLPDSGNASAIALFSRDPATGELIFDERILEHVDEIALSPDGLHLYTGPSGLGVYARDPASGRLSFVDVLYVNGTPLPSSDGRHLYLLDGGEIHIYSRDSATGLLTFLHTVVPDSTVGAAAFSSDGRHLYALLGAALAVYERDDATGLLGLVELQSDLTHEPVTMFPGSVAASPDGSVVLVGGEVALTVFLRDAVSGRLTLAGNHFTGDFGIGTLEGPRAFAFTPDGRHMYAASFAEDALYAFTTASIFSDGFESGTTSVWSSAEP